MSDSDDDLMAESMLRLRHNALNSMAPNTNITSFSFRNNTMTSMLTSKYERPRNGMRSTYQRSNNMYYRRGTSPISMKSCSDSRMQHFHNNPGGSMSSHRSVFNGRSGSPMSIRSIDSKVSAADIAEAFKNVNFNKYDLRIIKEAYNKFMKNQTRRRIEKRKNLKLFLKGHRRKDGDDDSGEQGSDSSLSSDDCRSSRTFRGVNRSGPRSTKTYITHLRSTLRDCDMYKDCTENLKQTKIRNMFALNNIHVNNEENDTTFHHNQKHDISIVHNNCHQNVLNVTLKNRFTKGANSFLLPSQRFNKPVPKPTDENMSIYQQKERLNVNKNTDTESEKEEIFPEITIRENPQHKQQKRILEDSDVIGSDKKRFRVKSKTQQRFADDVNNVTKNDFNFIKPQMPVRKSASNKKEISVPERIIAMSRPITSDNIDLEVPKRITENIENKLPVNSTEIEECSNQTQNTQNSTELSMRPSFIKRKLFTQNLDVAENINMNIDNVVTNSPQSNLYSAGREKNKVRKLVTSQSCLSRDVLNDNNVLELIHKIVPPDQINITCNKKEVSKTNDNDKWDVTSVISMCNSGDVSDTFTDEEIFKAPNNLNKKQKSAQNTVEIARKTVESVPKTVKSAKDIKPKLQPNFNIYLNPCQVIVDKLPAVNSKINHNKLEPNRNKNIAKKTVSSCIKSFWDTDFESDREVEERIATPWISKSNQNLGNSEKNGTDERNLKKNTTKGTILTIRSLQNKTILNNTAKSAISKVSKKTIDVQADKNNKISNNLNNSKKDGTLPDKIANMCVKNKKLTQKNCEAKASGENKKLKSAQTKELSKNSQTSKKENQCNTTRESLRLKEKKEKKEKLNNTLNNSEKRPRGRPPKSKNRDILKPTNTSKCKH